VRPSPKPMMHIAYPPYFHKIYKCPAIFAKFTFSLLNLRFFFFPYFDLDAFMHVLDIPGLDLVRA